ncbi:MAG TPA: PstS family phosphate ABC transporter substrate-binding protein [Actinomycetota bacterium]|nr:PstS family phosphate ABC transporter substrate-binding protein [Actinomycetota bacterium]
MRPQPKAAENAKKLGVAIAIMALTGFACGEASTQTSGAGGTAESLAGEIAIDGSSTVFPIAQAVSEDFQIENPDVKVSVGFAGTGGGFEAFCAGDTDISTASRAIEEEEVDCLAKAGIEYTEFQVGVDGLSIVTHPDTDWVDCITFDQVTSIYQPKSKVTNWNDVDPSWPDEPIKIFGPDPDSGTYDYFAEEVVDPDAEEPATRDDMTQSADDNVLVQGVGGEQGSIGYFGFAYFEENAQQLKALEVDNGDSGCVEPSTDTVKSNDYPLSRPLFIYVANASADRPEVAALMDFWVNNAAEYAAAVGYIEVPAEADTANQEALSRIGS